MEMASQFSGIVQFLAYFIAALVLTAIFLTVYMRITPYNEFDLIDKGNTAAACSLSGALFGFIIPLASAIIHSVNFLDMLLWGAVALGVQVLVYLLVRQLFKDLPSAIQDGIVSKGVFLGALSMAAGILNAACMSY